MADVERSVSIIFGATDQTGTAISGVSSKLNALQGSVTEIAGPLADVANKVLALETAFGVLAAGGMAVATSKASEFGLAFAEISTLIDKPKEALGQFKTDILDYAQGSTQSLDKINGALYEGISAGLKYEDSIKFVGEAEKLAVGSKADLTSTTKTLISTLNAYGESTDQAGKYSDILFQTIKVGQTTMPELSSSLAQVTGLASSGKVPFETLGAAIAALTASGLPTSQAITGIKSALENIIKPSEKAEKMAASLGVKFDAQALAAKGLDGVLNDVYKATGGNITKMAELFGSVEGLNAVMVLASDKAGKFKESLEAMKGAAGSTTEAYGKMKDEFKNVQQELVNNVDIALVKIGEKFIPALTSIESGLKDVFKNIAKSVDEGAFDPLFSAIDKFGASLGEQLKAIGQNLPEALKNIDYSKLIESISGLGKSLGEAFSALFAGIDLSTPEGLTAAIQKLVDGLTAFQNVTAGIVEAWKPFLSALGNAIDYFNSLDAATQSSVGQILGWAQQITAAAAVVGVLTAAISLAGSGISTLGSLGTAAVASLTATTTAATGLTAAIVPLTAAAAAFSAGWLMGKQLYETIPIVKEFGDNLGTVIWQMVHYDNQIAKTTENAKAQAEAARVLAERVGALSKKYDELPDEKTITVASEGIQEAVDKCKELGLKVEDIPREKIIELMVNTEQEKAETFGKALDKVTAARTATVKVELDQASIDAAYAERQKKLPDSQWVYVKTDVDGNLLLESKKQVEKYIPETKTITVDAKADKESFEKVASLWVDLTKTKIEWAAKLEVADLEAQTKRIEAAFSSLNEGIKSTSDSLGTLGGLLKDSATNPNINVSKIEEYMKREYEFREQEFQLQKELIDAQVAAMQARTAALASGEGLFTIQTDGMEPSLLALLNDLASKMQVQISQTGGDMLLGLTR